MYKKQLEKFLLNHTYRDHYDLYGLSCMLQNGERLTHADLFWKLQDLIKELDFAMAEKIFSCADWEIPFFKKDHRGFSYIYSTTIIEEDREK